MITLRFEGGPCDGREEHSSATPDRLVRTPDAADFLRSLDRGDPTSIEPETSCSYELSELDHARGFAIYRPSV
jgi:hypothetical protein